MKLNLPDYIASPQDLTSVIDELRDYEKWFSHEAMKKQLHATKKTTEEPMLSIGASQLLRELQVKKGVNATNLDQLISELEHHSKIAPSIHVILAAPAPNSIKKDIVGWCRKNLSPDILVNFQFNSNILGGMVVRYGSRIFDWSFRRKILAERKNFLGALDNVR